MDRQQAHPGTVATDDVPPGDLRGALDAEPWASVERGWLRRESAALRARVAAELTARPGGGGSVAADRDEVLRVWRRFSQAVFTHHAEPLLALLGPEAAPGDGGPGPRPSQDGISWASLAHLTVGHLVDRAPDAAEPASGPCHATLAVFLYFECLVFWEHSDDYGPKLALAGELEALARDYRHVVDLGGGSVAAASVIDAAARSAVELVRQFRVEEAIGSCVPDVLRERAAEVVDALDAIRAQLAEAWEAALHTDPAGASAVAPLAALLFVDIEHTEPYYRLLAEHVGPAQAAFVDDLEARARGGEVAARVGEAIEACRAFEESERGRAGVTGSETRAHRLVLEQCRDVLAAGCPSLVVDEGEVVYLFPFGLPVATSGDDPVRRFLREHLDGSSEPVVRGGFRLGGAPVALDDTPQTDAWLDSPAADQLDYVGVRLLFDEHELVLRTADGTLYRDLGLEVRLGGLGNHYVRISVGTDTLRSADGGATWASSCPWDPHRLDQFLRRINDDVGQEEVWLHRRDDPGVEAAPEVTVHGLLLGLAVELVADLAAFSRTLHLPGTDDRDELLASELAHDTVPVITEFLRRHAHPVVVVTRASARGEGVRTPVERPRDLEGLVGAGVLSTGQRPFPQSPTEWIRFPFLAGSDTHPAAISGRIRGELVACSGDTTLVFAPTLPNWQALETRELTEFACSLTGVYSRRHNWLSAALHDVEQRTAEASAVLEPVAAAGKAPSRPALLTVLEEMRQTEDRLDDSLNHVQGLLGRAQRFRLSRDQQSRELVQGLFARNGVSELQEALGATVASAAAQQRLVRTRVERLAAEVEARTAEERERAHEARGRPVQLLLTVLAVFGVIDLFWWSSESWELVGNHWVWMGELAVLLVATGLVLGATWRRRH